MGINNILHRGYIASESALKERFTLLTSAPAIGEVCARTLIALLPELGHVSRAEIAALVGVAPWVKESGNCKGRPMIYGGRMVIRHTLYMGGGVLSPFAISAANGIYITSVS